MCDLFSATEQCSNNFVIVSVDRSVIINEEKKEEFNLNFNV